MANVNELIHALLKFMNENPSLNPDCELLINIRKTLETAWRYQKAMAAIGVGQG